MQNNDIKHALEAVEAVETCSKGWKYGCYRVTFTLEKGEVIVKTGLGPGLRWKISQHSTVVLTSLTREVFFKLASDICRIHMKKKPAKGVDGKWDKQLTEKLHNLLYPTTWGSENFNRWKPRYARERFFQK